jgi:hypothetical protein
MMIDYGLEPKEAIRDNTVSCHTFTGWIFGVLYAYASRELGRLNKHFWLSKLCGHDAAMGDLQLLARCVPAESPSPGACMNPCGPVEGPTLTGFRTDCAPQVVKTSTLTQQWKFNTSYVEKCISRVPDI